MQARAWEWIQIFGRAISNSSGPLCVRMRRDTSVSVEKRTSLPSRANLEIPNGCSCLCLSQKPAGSVTMPKIPPTSGTTRLGPTKLLHTTRNHSCAGATRGSATRRRQSVVGVRLRRRSCGHPGGALKPRLLKDDVNEQRSSGELRDRRPSDGDCDGIHGRPGRASRSRRAWRSCWTCRCASGC